MLDELKDMRHLFVTCCVFHNMLLDFDSAAFSSEASDSSFGSHDASVLGQRTHAREFGASATMARDVVVDAELDVSFAGDMSAAPADSPFLFNDAPADDIPLYYHDGASQATHYTLRNALATHVRCCRPQHDV